MTDKEPTMKEDIILANELLNKWCNTGVINYYGGIEALGNLFKYAVPKAIEKIMGEQECDEELAYAILFKKWLQKLELDIPNHVGTLFWAIWEIIKK